MRKRSVNKVALFSFLMVRRSNSEFVRPLHVYIRLFSADSIYEAMSVLDKVDVELDDKGYSAFNDERVRHLIYDLGIYQYDEDRPERVVRTLSVPIKDRLKLGDSVSRQERYLLFSAHCENAFENARQKLTKKFVPVRVYARLLGFGDRVFNGEL